MSCKGKKVFFSAVFLSVFFFSIQAWGQDFDGDGLPDSWENKFTCVKYNLPDSGADPDFDGLPNFTEYMDSKHPCINDLEDMDGDQMPDGWENQYPCVDSAVPDGMFNSDEDSLTNLEEYHNYSNPCVAEGQSGGDITPSLTTSVSTVSPGQTFTVSVNVDVSNNTLMFYNIGITYPHDFLMLEFVEPGNNSEFRHPMFDDPPDGFMMRLFDHSHMDLGCVATGSINLAKLHFRVLEYAPPGQSFEIMIQPDAFFESCTGLPLDSLAPSPWPYVTINTIPFNNMTGAFSMQKFMDLDGNYLPDESDLTLFRKILFNDLQEGDLGYMDANARQCDINGNAVADYYDLGRMEALIRPIRLIHGGVNGRCDSALGGDDVAEIPPNQGLPGAVCVKDGGNQILETAPGGDDQESGLRILTGDDGICDSTAEGDDIQVIPLGFGEPNMVCITPGDNGIMESTKGGDDQDREDAKPTADLMARFPQSGEPAKLIPIEPVTDAAEDFYLDDIMPVPITVKVVDRNGQPKAGMSPIFTVNQGAGIFLGSLDPTIFSGVESDFFIEKEGPARGEVTAVFQPALGPNQVKVQLLGSDTIGIAATNTIYFDIHVLDQTTVQPTSLSVSLVGGSQVMVGATAEVNLVLMDGNTPLHGLAHRLMVLSERNYAKGMDPGQYGGNQYEAMHFESFEETNLAGWTVSGDGVVGFSDQQMGMFGDWSLEAYTEFGAGFAPVIRRYVSTIGFRDLLVGFQWKFMGEITSDTYIKVEYSPDGGATWLRIMQNTLSSYSGGWKTERLYLKGDESIFDSGFDLRFIMDGGTADSAFFLDNIIVSGVRILFRDDFENYNINDFPYEMEPTSYITTGPNGINDTFTVGNDDVYVIPFGQGEPFFPYIFPGDSFGLDSEPAPDDMIGAGPSINTGPDGVANTVPAGSDYKELEVGHGAPWTLAIFPGPNQILETMPGGDDELVGHLGPSPRIQVDATVNGSAAPAGYHGNNYSSKFLFVGTSMESPFPQEYAVVKKLNLQGMEQVKVSFYSITNGQLDYAGVTGDIANQIFMVEVSDNGGKSWVPVWDFAGIPDSAWTKHEIELHDDSRFSLTNDFLIRWRITANSPEMEAASGDYDGVYLDDILITGVSEIPDKFGSIKDTYQNGVYKVKLTTMTPVDEVLLSAVYRAPGLEPLYAEPEAPLSVYYPKAEPDSIQVLPSSFTLNACETMEVTVVGRYRNPPTPPGQLVDMTKYFRILVNGPAREIERGLIRADCFTGSAPVDIRIFAEPLVPGLYDPGGGGSGQQTGDVSGRIYKPTYQGAGDAPVWIDLGGGEKIYSHTDSNGFHYFQAVPAGTGYTLSSSLSGYTKRTQTSVSVTAGENTTVTFALPSGANFDGDTLDDGDDDDDDDDNISDATETSAGTDPHDPDSDGDGYTDDVDEFPTDPAEWLDTDGDYIGNNEDEDDDGDGISDTEEETVGADGYITDPLLWDTDGGGESDGSEVANGRNPNNPADDDSDDDGLANSVETDTGIYVSPTDTGTDPDDNDTDGDGLEDGDEVETYGTDPTKADTDNDYLPDNIEVSYCTGATTEDTDGDGLNDGTEDANHDGIVDTSETDPCDDDTDGDGLDDYLESITVSCLAAANPDTDGDGICDGDTTVSGVCVLGEDMDLDGTVDPGETNPCSTDTDGDGLGDYLERITVSCLSATTVDTDGDGINDGVEDADHDGTVDAGETNPCSADTDGDGLDDYLERITVSCLSATTVDTDGDGIDDGIEDADHDGMVDPGETNPCSADTDGDGLDDYLERITVSCLSATTVDTDGDGLDDGVEDADHDGMVDPGETNPCSADTDGDGLDDYLERITVSCLSATTVDTDGDGICDGNTTVSGVCVLGEDMDLDGIVDPGETNPCSTDTDGDGLDDYLERITVSCLSATTVDTDGDGLDDGVEDANHNGVLDALETDPCDTDTDDDLIPDGYEVTYGLDPRSDDSASDLDGDSLSNYNEYINGTYANSWDSDNDYLPDGYEVMHSGDTTDPLDPTSADGSSDFDSDGNSNAHEYWNGSDPWSPDPDDHQNLTNLGCFYWAEGDGDGVITGADLSKLRNTVAQTSFNYSNVIPPSRMVHDLDADGNVNAADLSVYRNFVARNAISPALGSTPTGLSVMYVPSSTVEVGETCHVSVKVNNYKGTYTPGVAVKFSVSSNSVGSATILGGDGSSSAGDRYDFSLTSAESGEVRVYLRIDSAGTVEIEATAPSCGSSGNGRYMPTLTLSPNIEITTE